MILTINKKTYEAGELVAYVAELEKQQFTLRNERNTFLTQNEQYEKDLIDFNEKLIKAKEIILKLSTCLEGHSNNSFEYALLQKAEQFLEEADKC